MPTPPERTIADELSYWLYNRHWVTFSRIHDNAVGSRRILDFAAINLYPSRGGILLHGGEIKLHRGDWLQELRNPGKAEGWASACHEFFVIAAKGVVQEPEVPEAWGWIELSDCDKIAPKIRKPAFRKTIPSPSWELLAALMRAALKDGMEMVPRAELEQHLKSKSQELRAQLESMARERQFELYPDQDAIENAEHACRRTLETLGLVGQHLLRAAESSEKAIARLSKMKPVPRPKKPA